VSMRSCGIAERPTSPPERAGDLAGRHRPPDRELLVPPFTEVGNVVELGNLFGGRDALYEGIDDLGQRLFRRWLDVG